MVDQAPAPPLDPYGRDQFSLPLDQIPLTTDRIPYAQLGALGRYQGQTLPDTAPPVLAELYASTATFVGDLLQTDGKRNLKVYVVNESASGGGIGTQQVYSQSVWSAQAVTAAGIHTPLYTPLPAKLWGFSLVATSTAPAQGYVTFRTRATNDDHYTIEFASDVGGPANIFWFLEGGLVFPNLQIPTEMPDDLLAATTLGSCTLSFAYQWT